MSVEVGGDRSTNRWHRGVWSDVVGSSSFSISIDQPRASSETKEGKSTANNARSMPSPASIPTAASDHEISGLRSRHSSMNHQWGGSKSKATNFFLEHEEDQGVTMSEGSALLPLTDGRFNDTDDGHIMIPLTNMSTTSAEVATAGAETGVTTRRSREGRARFFKRAMSCDVDNRAFLEAVEGSGGSAVDGQLTFGAKFDRQRDLLKQESSGERDVMSFVDIASLNSKRTSNQFNMSAEEGRDDAVVRDNLKATDKDSGIVCSDEDLRSILSEVTLSRRMSAEAKRERMKANRSLSLDSSSFFKLHIKRLQADSPYWLSRILSQRERRDSGSGSGTSSGTAAPPPCSGNSSAVPAGDEQPCTDTIRRRAVLQSVVITEVDTTAGSLDDGDRLSDPSHSRRASTVSGCSDDEYSLLLQVENGCGSSGRKHGNINPCGVETKSPPTSPPAAHPVSKVVWNESSVVDAELFGHAIEIYLTSGGSAASSMTSGEAIVTSDVTRAVTPMVSTLKGLFVK